MHPSVDQFLHMPEIVNNCGFIFTTNGTLREDLDPLIAEMGWLAAVSLHGHKKAHNTYSKSDSFDTVVSRIGKLAKTNIVHIYSVLHDELTEKDIKWLFHLRDETGVTFLRFIMPREFGRYRALTNSNIQSYLLTRLDENSALKVAPSKTRFLTVQEELRMSH